MWQVLPVAWLFWPGAGAFGCGDWGEAARARETEVRSQKSKVQGPKAEGGEGGQHETLLRAVQGKILGCLFAPRRAAARLFPFHIVT